MGKTGSAYCEGVAAISASCVAFSVTDLEAAGIEARRAVQDIHGVRSRSKHQGRNHQPGSLGVVARTLHTLAALLRTRKPDFSAGWTGSRGNHGRPCTALSGIERTSLRPRESSTTVAPLDAGFAEGHVVLRAVDGGHAGEAPPEAGPLRRRGRIAVGCRWRRERARRPAAHRRPAPAARRGARARRPNRAGRAGPRGHVQRRLAVHPRTARRVRARRGPRAGGRRGRGRRPLVVRAWRPSAGQRRPSDGAREPG